MPARRNRSVNCLPEFPATAIAAIVVTHESASTIDDCLDRLRRARDVVEIRVVDNDSQDGTLDIVQRHAAQDPRVRFIGNPDNPGFAVGCNQGAADSQAPWLALVNPDLLVEADSLARLRTHAEGFAAALLGVDLVDEAGVRDEAARRRDPDFSAMIGGMIAAPGRASKLGVPLREDLALQPVDAISGALMLLPRALFQRIGGFDTGYRLHAEDLDLCRRARQAGAMVAVANDIRVVHIRGVSSRARPVFVEWHKHRGLWRYFRTFEASRRGLPTRAAVWTAIWAHFAVVWLKRMLARR